MLERRLERYRNELQRIVDSWLEEVKALGPEEIATALIVLERRMQNAAERHIRIAYRLGLNGRALNEDDERKVDIALESNRVFLQTSLLPAIEQRIRIAQESGEIPFDEAVDVSRDFATNRGGLYAGVFWTAIWVGLEASIEREFGRQATATMPVQRLLDPRAEHCATCPPKAGEYQSWDDMLAVTGGLPADGSDACHSNCRCVVQVLVNGVWAYAL